MDTSEIFRQKIKKSEGKKWILFTTMMASYQYFFNRQAPSTGALVMDEFLKTHRLNDGSADQF